MKWNTVKSALVEFSWIWINNFSLCKTFFFFYTSLVKFGINLCSPNRFSFCWFNCTSSLPKHGLFTLPKRKCFLLQGDFISVKFTVNQFYLDSSWSHLLVWNPRSNHRGSLPLGSRTVHHHRYQGCQHTHQYLKSSYKIVQSMNQ